MTRKPIGTIPCPWCARQAELHQSEERTKLNPDDPAPKPAYPKKLFVACPPTSGYRGCGTTLANSALAQERIRELAHMDGAPRNTASAKPAPTNGADTPAAPPPAPATPAAPKKRPALNLFDW